MNNPVILAPEEWAEFSAELTKLKAFALWALDGYRDGDIGDIDGGALQDKAEELGLLVAVTVTEPCCDNCNCMSWDDFPQTCYRIPEWLKEQENECE